MLFIQLNFLFQADEVSCRGDFKRPTSGAQILEKAWNPMIPKEEMQNKVCTNKFGSVCCVRFLLLLLKTELLPISDTMVKVLKFDVAFMKQIK